MQNKSAIWIFTILMSLACIYQLSLTFLANNFEGKAYSYSVDQSDSLSQANPDLASDVINKFRQDTEEQYLIEHVEDVVGLGLTYEYVRDQKLNLGLDLQGGMNVTLEVSVYDMIKALSGKKDPRLVKALDRAKELQKSQNGEFVELFGIAWQEVSEGTPLAAMFQTKENIKKFPRDASDEETLEVLAAEAEASIDRTEQVLRRRIDNLGVVQPKISRLQGSGRIEIELPGIKDKSRVRKVIQGTAKLEFWEIYTLIDEDGPAQGLDRINTALAEELKMLGGATEPEADTSASIVEGEAALEPVAEEADTTANQLDQLTDEGADLTDADKLAEFKKNHPLYSVLQIYAENGRYTNKPYVGFARRSDTAQVMSYLRRPEFKSFFSGNPKFLWDVKPQKNDNGVESFALYAMRVPDNGMPPMDGGVVVDARVESSALGVPEVSVRMNSDGTRKWAKITGRNVGKSVAISLDNLVYSAPTVQSAITGGNTSISGNFNQESASDLANVLKAGKLPAPAVIIAEDVVGPTLGKKNITAGAWSFLVALALILIYMIFYYSKAGMVADVALLVNMFFIFGVLASLGSTLTLPGIAGIVLTIGMSVDANVLIYERIREELALNKGERLAVEDGYKAAYSSILDANITTLLTGIILFVFGTGPIKGFAVTLIVGILTSLFCAIFITRLIFDWQLEKGNKVSFSTALTKGAFKNINWSFIPRRKLFYGISSVIIIAGIGSLATNGLDLGIDFTGGRSFIVEFQEDVDADKLRKTLSKTLDGAEPEVKQRGGDDRYEITTKYMIDQTGQGAQDQVDAAVTSGLDAFGASYVPFTESQLKGASVAQDLKSSAIQAVIASLFIIFGYIAFRFKKWEFGVGALVAMFHDVLIVLSIFSIFYSFMPFSLEIDQAFIAALLTVVGYSINDTVVVFDRIREYLGIHKRKDTAEVVNNALNSTLSRTINTSVSTFVVLLMIFLAGGDSIKGFVFALMVGVVVGTYSSLCIATPIALDLSKRREAKANKK